MRALDTFVLGGFAALLAVNRLLDAQLGGYATRNMDAASAILDFMDDLIPYLFVCGAALLVLALSTVCVAVWRKARSPVLRYGTTVLALALIAAGAWSWVFRIGTTPTMPPMTPTPVAQVPPSRPKPLSGPTLSNQVPDSAITSFATTPDGALWYAFDKFDDIGGVSPGALQHGLYRLKDGRTSHWDVPGTIRVLKAAPDGSLYVGAGNGVLRYKAEKWEPLADVVRDSGEFVPFTIAFDLATAYRNARSSTSGSAPSFSTTGGACVYATSAASVRLARGWRRARGAARQPALPTVRCFAPTCSAF